MNRTGHSDLSCNSKGKASEHRLGGQSLVFKFPKTSQSLHILLLEYSNEFLGCGMYLRVTIVALLDTYVQPLEAVPGCW